MIKETKEAVKGVVLFANAVNKCVTDAIAGETSIIKDIAAFFPALVAAPAALRGIGLVPGELRNVTAEDKADIVAMIQDDLVISNADAHKYVDQALEILLQFWLMFGNNPPALVK